MYESRRGDISVTSVMILVSHCERTDGFLHVDQHQPQVFELSAAGRSAAGELSAGAGYPAFVAIGKHHETVGVVA
jgi:hypothetical protein